MREITKVYKTVQGDTWDVIAFKVYPNGRKEKEMHLLLQNNPMYQDIVIFPANVEIFVPKAITQGTGVLPPWLR